jgi:pimeloyl-ACP methyl ester carboxylesterase
MLALLLSSGVPVSGATASSDSKSIPTPVLIMLSGFPDTARSWSRLSPHFEASHHVLALAMPSYEADALPAGHRWGHRLTDIVVELTELIRSYKSRGCPVHLVGHDWGAAVLLMLVSQPSAKGLVDKLVLLDIGALSPLRLSLKQIAVMLLYQSYFAFVFVVSRLLPRESWASPLLVLFPFRTLGPCPYEVRPLSWIHYYNHRRA